MPMGSFINMPLDAEIADEDWKDFFIGFRTVYDLSEKWFFSFRLDAAVAGDSDSSWNALVTFDRRIGDSMASKPGLSPLYRRLRNRQWCRLPLPGTWIRPGPFVGYTWIF